MKQYWYYRQPENGKAEKISKNKVLELLQAYDTWTEKKLFEVLHSGTKLHPWISKNDEICIYYTYFARRIN